MELQRIFGKPIFNALTERMVEEYFGSEMDARAALVCRADLFERALLGMVGEAGEKILVMIWNKVSREYSLDSKTSYRKKGDLVLCMSIFNK